MKTPYRALCRLGGCFAAVVLIAVGTIPAAAALDGSTPMLCAISTIMECDSSGQCERHGALQRADFPAFLRIHVDERRIIDAGNANRTTQIRSAMRLNGQLILQGGENGRGWSATIAETTGRMSAGVVADEYAFALFGACTTP